MNRTTEGKLLVSDIPAAPHVYAGSIFYISYLMFGKMWGEEDEEEEEGGGSLINHETTSNEMDSSSWRN